jgi:hypothetical protein
MQRSILISYMDEEPSEDIARDYLMDEAGKVKKRTP